LFLNSDYESLKEKMLLDYSTISHYTESEEKDYKKGLFNVMKPQFNYLSMSFKEYDPKGNGLVKFYQLRRILDLLQGELQDSLIEFLINYMKSNKYLKKESVMHLDDLNYYVSNNFYKGS
jgi:Ca2+-binding EF-hand superfamily protein